MWFYRQNRQKIMLHTTFFRLLHHFFSKNLCENKNMFYFCTRNQQLGYGVMVTLQILVLSF